MSPEGSSVLFRRSAPDVRPRAIHAYARRLQKELAKGRAFESLITGDAELRRLNREFRGKDEPTDVLSFPTSGALVGQGFGPAAGLSPGAELPHIPSKRGLQPRPLAVRRAHAGIPAPLGSLAISIARARAQARAHGHSTETEIRILMLHGLLHLLGYDHETDSGRMARAEKRWREIFNLPDGLIERAQP